jgi:hypothetical protein
MSEQVVQVADAASPTKNMRTIEATVAGNTVQSEVVVLSSDGSDKYDARQGMPPQSTTGNINGTGQNVRRTLVGGKGVAITVTGTWNGGATGMLFYGSTDGTTFFAFSSVIKLTTYGLVTNIKSSGVDDSTYLIPAIAGLQAVQIASVSWTSGTANITITESEGFATGFLVNGVSVNGLPAATASADNTANPSLTQIEVFPMVWNGSTWDRMSTSGNLGVSIIASNTIPVSQTLLGATDQPDVTVNHAGTLPVSQSLLASNDRPDVTVNHTGRLPTTGQIVDPYTGTAARVDSNGNLMISPGTSPNYTSATPANLVQNDPQYGPLNPTPGPVQSNPMIGYKGYRVFK